MEDRRVDVRALPANSFVAAVNSDIRATGSHVMERLAYNDFAVVDARTSEEYNGWQFYGESGGGMFPKQSIFPMNGSLIMIRLF